MQDGEAIRRLALGDGAGMAELAGRHQLRALRIAFLILRDRGAAEDAARRAFVQLYTRPELLDTGRPFEAQLPQIVAGAAVREAAQLDRSGPAHEPIIQAHEAPWTAALLEQADSDAAVWAALGELPVEERAAVVLRHYAGAGARPDAGSRLWRVLDEYAARGLAADVDLRPAIERELLIAGGGRGRRPPAAPPSARAVWIAGLALAGVVAIVAVLAWLPAVGAPSLPEPEQATPGATVQVVKANGIATAEANGYKLAFEPLGTDTQTIVISYSISGPSVGQGETFLLARPGAPDSRIVLFDGNGAVHAAAGGAHAAPQRWPTPQPGTPAVARGTLRFDVAAPDDSDTRSLYMELDLYKYMQPTPGAEQNLTPVEQPWRAVAGPFAFSFELPVDRRRRHAELQQVVAARGITVTLEEVTLTPFETRLIARVETDDSDPNWYPLMPTLAGPVTAAGPGRWSAEKSEDGRFRFRSYPPGGAEGLTMDYGGEWRLTIPQFGRGEQGSRKGPWSFRFDLPGGQEGSQGAGVIVQLSVEPGAQEAPVRVDADGKTLFDGMLEAGSSRIFSGANSVRVSSERADLVLLTVNGINRGYLGLGDQSSTSREWGADGMER